MSKNSIPQVPEPGNPLDPDFDTYREIVGLIPQMTVTETSNPHRHVVAGGWRFAVDTVPDPQGDCPFVFGESPDSRIYLVDGIAALTVVEMIDNAATMDEARENARCEMFLQLIHDPGLSDEGARRHIAHLEHLAEVMV